MHNLIASVTSRAGADKIELLTLKQFLKVFEFDKFGERACKLLKEEMQAKMKQEDIKSAAKSARQLLAHAFSFKS